MALFVRDITSACFCRISQHQQVYLSTIEYQRASLRILPIENYNLPFMRPKIPYLSSLLVTCHQSSRLYGVIWMGLPGLKNDSNTPLLYSLRLNSVIYWLINHCTDWTQTAVMLFSPQLIFHDIIYHIQQCNIDNRMLNVVFTTIRRSKHM